MKRILCMLLVICMVFSFMPHTAFAVQEAQQENAEILSTEGEILTARDLADEEKPLNVLQSPALTAPELPENAISGITPLGENQLNSDPSPSIRYWISQEGYGDAISGNAIAGKRYYFNYEIYDSVSGEYWDSLVSDDYEVTVTLYDPDGETIYSQTNNTDSFWVSTIFFDPGVYYYEVSLTGVFSYTDGSEISFTYGLDFTIVEDDSIYDNCQIHVSPTSVTMDPGGSQTVSVWATGDFDGSLFRWESGNESVATCAWGSRTDLRTYDLTVNGHSSGSTTVTLYYLHNVTEEVLDSVTLSVTVSGSSSSNFTVTFEAEGGSNVPSPVSASPGSVITIPSNVPTFSTVGRMFTHWEAIDSMGNTISVYPGGSLAVIEDLEFYACWLDAMEIDIYSTFGSDVSRSDSWDMNFPGQYYYYCFNPGGSASLPITYEFLGTGTIDSYIHLYNESGEEIASNDDGAGINNQFKLTYTFEDNNLYYIKVRLWSSSNVGTISFSVSCLTGAEVEDHTVSFTVDNGTGAPASQTVTHGSTFTIPATVPTSNTFGNYFSCWVGWENGDTIGTFFPGDQVTVTGDINFDAMMVSPDELDLSSLLGTTEPMSMSETIYFSNQEIFYYFYPGGSATLPVTYRFEGLGSVDNRVYIYNARGDQIAYDDDSGTNTQFLLEREFTDNELYYLKVRMYSANTGELPYEITCLTDAPVVTLSYSDPYSSTVRTDEGFMSGTMYIVDEIPFHVGHTFLGWGTEDSDEVVWIPGDEISISEDTTIYAKYQNAVAISPTTTFVEQAVTPFFTGGHYWFTYTPRVSTSYQVQDVDSGSDTYVVIYDANETLLAENDDNEDFAFRVASQMSSNNTYYIGVATYDAPATFHFLVDRGYRITYNANGGTNAPAQTYVYSEMGGTLTEDVPTREGYRFLGWATSASATAARYASGEQVDIDTNTTLYAVWREQSLDCEHEFGDWVVTIEPTCTEPGEETRTCTLCGEPETREVEPLGHNYRDGECTRCHEEDPNPAPEGLIRLAGANRYATGFAIADQLKENMGVDQFRCVVVAYGLNFPDALTGSYLASVKSAPILLTDPSVDSQVLSYLRTNLVAGGQVYILGGEAAVSRTFEVAAQSMGFSVTRLKGAGRYETNLAILREAGVNADDEILIATGTNYADSLSASATGLPMLLVGTSLTDSQREFLQGTSKRFVILGGTGAVNAAVEAELNRIGSAVRVKGSNRYLTSVLIANRYFANTQAAVLAYAQGFPDGLCGGPLAMSMGAPLILTSNESPDAADGYIRNISSGAVTGGTGRISDDTVREIFDLPDDTPIPKR